MSLADEVLADHGVHPISKAQPCFECFEPFPCPPYRLATQLRAAEQVGAAARELAADNERRGLHGAHVLKVKMRLAEYDKGGRS